MTQDFTAAPSLSPATYRAPWFGPSAGSESVVVPGRVELVANRKLSFALHGIELHDDGVVMQLELKRVIPWMPDPYDPKSWTPSFHRYIPRAGRLPSVIAPEVLRFGIRYPDGREAWNIDPGPWALEPDEEPEHPVLVSLGGTQAPLHWEQTFWLWPRPPELTLQAILEWGFAGIPNATATLPLS